MEVIDQQVINDNKEIYAKIQTGLLSAEFEILIATAWFTDEELFNILLRKLGEGVRIEVIIADNQENEKLDFTLLCSKGASVQKIKNSGYGIMNQKFCVIDRRLALHGSYNWTVNAKKNNQESIISTNHQETIDSLIENFGAIKARILGDPPPPKTEKPRGIPVEIPAKAGTDFEKVLDTMIAAEIGSFDRKLLREQGFERCKSNKGDHQVLYKAFDTVYSVFINDIDVIDDKKKRLVTRIEEHRVRTIDLLNSNSQQHLDHLEREHELNKTKLLTRRTNLAAEIDIIYKNVADIRSEKVPSALKGKDVIEQQIKAAEREFITPKVKWFELIPTSVFCLALLIYLFVFYSSAAYILLFSVADAKAAQMAGSMTSASVQVFNPAALGKALHKGGTAPLFIFLFVFIPLAFAVIDAFVREMWKQVACFIFGIIVLDGAVAFKVTEAVHEVNYLSGNTTEKWHPGLAFTDTNFYLVFVFGAFGLFLFKIVFKKLMQGFEDRNPDILMQRNQVLIKQLREETGRHELDISQLKQEASDLEKQAIQLKAEDMHAENELTDLPIALNRELKRTQDHLSTDINTIEKTAAIYTVHVQSDNLPISVDALKDRINVFLEGWNDHLFAEFAVARATLKTTEAFDTAMAWQNEKLQTNKIDKRVKFNAGV